jgi:nitroreductase
MEKYPVFNAILNRRSIREYTDEQIKDEEINQILEAGRWAPSAKNLQPWRFIIMKDSKKIEDLCQFTKYANILRKSKVNILIFLDKNFQGDRTKCIQSIGACIQNMLLAAYELEIGTCWIGEIVNRHEKVEKFLNLPRNLELMALITLGKMQKEKKESRRIPLEKLLIKE